MTVGDFTQIPLSNQNCVQVWQAQPNSTVTFYNQDVIYPVYISRANLASLNSSVSIPVPPLGQVTLPGDRPLWALSQATQPLVVIPGDATFFGNTPSAALAVDTILKTFPATTQVVAGGAVEVYNGPITGTSFTLQVAGLVGVSPPSVPFMKVSLEWLGPAGDQIDLDQWKQSLTDVSPAISNMSVTCRGPTKTSSVIVRVTNYDTAACKVQGTILSSSRAVTFVRPRNVSNNIATTMTYKGITYSTPISAPASNTLGASDNLLVGAGAIAYRLMPTFPGLAQLSVTTSSGTNDLQVNLLGIDPDFAGASPPSDLFQLERFQSDTHGAISAMNLTLPRSPVLISFTNQNALQQSITYGLIAQEYAA